MPRMARRQKTRRRNGEGSIGWIPSEGRWRARITVHTNTGTKRKAFSAKTFEEAHHKMIQALANPSALLGEPQNITVSQYLESWLEGIQTNVRDKTYGEYERAVRRYILKSLGDLKLHQLNAAHVRNLRTQLVQSRKAPAYVGNILAVLSMALNQAVLDDLISKNVARGVKPPPKTKRAMNILSAAQAQKLIDAVRGTRGEAFYLLALNTGMRRGEILGLMWEDIDLEARTVRIERAVSTRKGGERWGPTKSGEPRTVELGPQLLEALKRHKSRQREERLAAKKWANPSLVFPSAAGSVIRGSTLKKDLDRALEAAGLPRIRFHDLRHTAVTLFLRNGTPPQVVAKIVGHKDPTITLRVYSHVLPDMQEEAVAKMDGLLS